MTCWGYKSELRTGSHECLACLVRGVLIEVLDEAGCEVFCLHFPLSSVFVGVARIKDCRIYARQRRRYLEVEVRDLLRRSGQDVTTEDSVNDTTGVADRDTLTRSVPTGVYEVCLRAGFLHLLNEFLSIFGRVELQECLSEASREGRSRLGDTTLGTCQLSGETAQEIVLGLLRSQNRYRRQNAESISGEEDDVLRCRTCRDRFNDLLDVVDRIGNTGVLGYALVSEIDLAVLVYGYVLEESVTTDRIRRRFGSVERVVLPVPERPKKIAVFLPSMSVLAEQCIEAIPFSGR